MDIHMPNVNGYESTKLIRAVDHPHAKTVPIVAMTANVFKEDVERCIEAGMNGHIGKPLNFDEVIAVLTKYLGISYAT
jgi:CheY-like chemotaxis protein